MSINLPPEDATSPTQRAGHGVQHPDGLTKGELQIVALLPRGDPEVLLLVYPNDQRLFVGNEDTPALWPMAAGTSAELHGRVRGLEEVPRVLQGRLVLWLHAPTPWQVAPRTRQRQVLALRRPRDLVQRRRQDPLDLMPVLAAHGRRETEAAEAAVHQHLGRQYILALRVYASRREPAPKAAKVRRVHVVGACGCVVEVPEDGRIKKVSKGLEALLVASNEAWCFHHSVAPVVHADLDAPPEPHTKRCLPIP
mmetsp:Transcript_19385/g.56263  ORF Transcript_19385/g.56263 Transcript_19385/m.56263 type:complete len:252 (+) Transcript_19385:1107-1862(+)